MAVSMLYCMFQFLGCLPVRQQQWQPSWSGYFSEVELIDNKKIKCYSKCWSRGKGIHGSGLSDTKPRREQVNVPHWSTPWGVSTRKCTHYFWMSTNRSDNLGNNIFSWSFTVLNLHYDTMCSLLFWRCTFKQEITEFGIQTQCLLTIRLLNNGHVGHLVWHFAMQNHQGSHLAASN